MTIARRRASLILLLPAITARTAAISSVRVTRRGAVAAAMSAALSQRPFAARADSSLWPIDGLFPDCPDESSCVSSQDDRPAVWDNPWIAEGATADEYASLRRFIERIGGRVTASDGERYLRAEFADKGPLGGATVDETEFFFTPDDTLVQFRSVRRGGSPDFGANRKRLEKARIALGWEKVPVLRNRRRTLIVAESPFDSFGPAMYSDVYGDKDPLAGAFKPPTKLERAWLRESDDRVRSK